MGEEGTAGAGTAVAPSASFETDPRHPQPQPPMNTNGILPALGALLLLAAPSLAQQVTFQGKVEDVQGTTNQFVLDCTNTSLSSPTIDLNPFVGVTVEITGDWNGSAANPAVVVSSIQAVPETFEIGGGAKIGEFSQLGFVGNPGELALGVLSRAPAFVPYPRANGVILVDVNRKFLQRVRVVGATGIVQEPFFIPNDPALVGFEFFGQGALLGNGVRMTNPDCKTIDT